MGSAQPPLWDNPLGTDGFEFIEYAAPDPAALGALFEQLGFTAIARHRSKNVLLYRQGEINFVVNAEPGSFAQAFARVHGPSICAIAFRVRDAALAYKSATEQGAPKLGRVARELDGLLDRRIARTRQVDGQVELDAPGPRRQDHHPV